MFRKIKSHHRLIFYNSNILRTQIIRLGNCNEQHHPWISSNNFSMSSSCNGMYKQSWPSVPLLDFSNWWSLNSVWCARKVNSFVTRNFSRQRKNQRWKGIPTRKTLWKNEISPITFCGKWRAQLSFGYIKSTGREKWTQEKVKQRSAHFYIR